MLKLLIVDDEMLTRSGIIDGIPWQEIGVDMVEQADDGTTALEIASKFNPNIILTDLRMPFMDGVEMSKRLRTLYPDVKIIFMSGYSDKEYLLSAIRLQVINYIEKPILLDELKSVLQEVVQEYRMEESKKEKELEKEKKMNMTLPFIRNEIAIRLLNKDTEISNMEDYFDQATLDISPNSEFITVIVRIIYNSEFNGNQFQKLREEFQNNLDDIFFKSCINGIYAFKDSEHLIIHLSSRDEKLDDIYIRRCLQKICEVIYNGKFFVAIGTRVNGVKGIYESYNKAVLALQKSFFQGYGSINQYTDDGTNPYIFIEEKLSSFGKYLEEGNKHEAIYFITSLTSELRKFENTLINYIKDIYFRLMIFLLKHAEKYGISFFAKKEDENYLWQVFSCFYTLDEVMKFSIKMVSDYFNYLDQLEQNKNVISKIMNYIHKYYMNENLSVKDISSYTFLSLAYMCTYFKQETGKTINQYITEYRIEKAKELLSDRTYRVSEIAGLVGYSDGNYFTRLFKKSLGVSPSEFRERVCK